MASPADSVLRPDAAAITRLLDSYTGPISVEHLRVVVVDAKRLEPSTTGRPSLTTRLLAARVPVFKSDDGARRLFVMPRGDAWRLLDEVSAGPVSAEVLTATALASAPAVLRVLRLCDGEASTVDTPLAHLRRLAESAGAVVAPLRGADGQPFTLDKSHMA